MLLYFFVFFSLHQKEAQNYKTTMTHLLLKINIFVQKESINCVDLVPSSCRFLFTTLLFLLWLYFSHSVVLNINFYHIMLALNVTDHQKKWGKKVL